VRLPLVVLLMLGVAGCVTPQSSVLTPEQLIIGANAFDAMELSAANYLRLPLCDTGSTPICRTKATSNSLAKAVRNARHARSQLEAYVNANPGKPDAVNLYQALVTSMKTLQGLLQKNNIN
jgi:hypothetical protein